MTTSDVPTDSTPTEFQRLERILLAGIKVSPCSVASPNHLANELAYVLQAAGVTFLPELDA